MSKSDEVIMVMDDDSQQARRPEFMEEGVEVPFERLDPQTLHNLICEFVSREWAEYGDSHTSLEDKVSQVTRQLKEKKAKVVFDLRSESCNIIVADKTAG